MGLKEAAVIELSCLGHFDMLSSEKAVTAGILRAHSLTHRCLCGILCVYTHAIQIKQVKKKKKYS